MKPFMDKDFLLSTETARVLYHEAAEGMPILDMQTAEELDPDYAGVTMEVGFFDAD